MSDIYKFEITGNQVSARYEWDGPGDYPTAENFSTTDYWELKPLKSYEQALYVDGEVSITKSSATSSETKIYSMNSIGYYIESESHDSNENESEGNEDDHIGGIGWNGNDDDIDGDGNDDDLIITGLGKDFISAGLGNDEIESGDDDDEVYGEDGDDIVYAGNGNDDIYGDLGDDDLYGEAGDDNLYGGDGDDTIEGGDGNDIVDAGAGDDLIIGGNGAGNDTYDGGKGIDEVKYTSAQAGIKVDLSGKKNNAYSYAIVDGKVVIDTFDSSHTGVDTLKNIENIVAGNYDDILIGSKSSNDISGEDGNDSISGLDGNDTLNGGNGNDILNGGKGADLMTGGADDDTYYIDNKSDIVFEDNNAGEDLLYSSLSYTLGDNIENLTLTGSATLGIGNELENEITGNSKNNTLSGNAGDDTINGGAGNDVITGGYGSDTLTGGAGKDKFVFDISPDGIDVDTITDFATKSDKLVFDNDAFSGLLTANGKLANKTGVALDAGDLLIGDVNENSSTGQHLLYNNTNGNLYYDADGTGGNSAVLLATLDGQPTIQIKDILIID